MEPPIEATAVVVVEECFWCLESHLSNNCSVSPSYFRLMIRTFRLIFLAMAVVEEEGGVCWCSCLWSMEDHDFANSKAMRRMPNVQNRILYLQRREEEEAVAGSG